MKSSPAFDKAFARLNPEQRAAVTTFDGPVLVVAGPGTGKTQILAMRIAYILLNEEIKPQNILALTFTESGVAAMKERLIELIGTTGYYVNIQTFHSFCNDIILEFPEKFSYRTRDFTNLTDIERFKMMRDIIDTLPLTELRSFRETYFYVRSILDCLKDLKKEGIAPSDFDRIVEEYGQAISNDTCLLNKNGSQGERYRKEIKKLEKNKELALIYHSYQERLETLGRYDYEDMIMFVVQKLKTDEELRLDLQERYFHFLIDEYQDTNGAQNFVVYQLANYFDNPNLFVVGDDDQSIYRFQGASLENMLYLNDKFKNISTVVLRTNYRSTQTILDAAGSVIEKNEDRITNPIYGFAIDKQFRAADSLQLTADSRQTESRIKNQESREETALSPLIKGGKGGNMVKGIGEELSMEKAEGTEKSPLERGVPSVAGRGMSTKATNDNGTQEITSEDAKLSLLEFSSGEIENYYLATRIQELIEEGIAANEIAIIYRNNQDVVDIINTFTRKNIPWNIEGGFDILRDNDIQRVIELLQVIVDPDQQDLLFRVLHHAAFGLIPLDLMKISRSTYNHKSGEKKMIDILMDQKKLAENGIQEARKIEEIAGKILFFQKESHNVILVELVEKMLREFGIIDHFLNTNSLRSIHRLNTLFNFLKSENYKNHKLSLAALLQDIELMASEGIGLPEAAMEGLEQGVRLMTAHKSKGLEFEYVFVVKCIDGKWGNPKKSKPLTLAPNVLTQQKLNEIPVNEDERRLFYVALTRAKRKISISFAHNYPLLDKKNAIPSQFIGEIDERFLRKEEVDMFERRSDEAIKLLFEPERHDKDHKEAEFLKELVKNYRMNPVGLNAYLRCPRQFQYDHILKVPRSKEKLQQFGTAVHAALELFFGELKKNYENASRRDGMHSVSTPGKEMLLSFYAEALQKELMTEADFSESAKEGKRVLSAYYDFYAGKFTKPLYLERNYNRVPLYFDGIPLTGVIDKIEPADPVEANGHSPLRIHIVDYKTGRPRSENDIKGLTETSRGDKSYFYQLLFYKLLVELDRDLQLDPVGGVLDFVFPEKDGSNFRQTLIEYKSEEFEEFKKILKDVYGKIQQLEFPKTTDIRNCETCPYRKICWKDTLF